MILGAKKYGNSPLKGTILIFSTKIDYNIFLVFVCNFPESGCDLSTCLVSDEVNDVVQGEGGGAVPAGDQVGRLLFPLVGRAGPGSDAGGVWRLVGGTLSLTSPVTPTSSSREFWVDL